MTRRLIVLKFGGSVLRDENTLRRAVHEIHRWRRDDYRVVAVVSALAGTTDRLLERCRALAASSSDHAVAAVVLVSYAPWIALSTVCLYPLLWWRIRQSLVRRGVQNADASLYAMACVFMKVPQAVGVALCCARRILRVQPRAIEYKTATEDA